jgi:hypothetical protein
MYHIYAPDAVLNARIPTRIHRKLAYALNNTRVEIRIRHKDEEPELVQHGRAPYPEEFTFNEIGWQDQIAITVRHNFALLPGPGRLLSRPASSPSGQSSSSGAIGYPTSSAASEDGYAAGTSGYTSPVFTYPLVATVRLGNEGEKPVLPYIQRTYGGGPVYESYEPPDYDEYDH